MTSQGEKKEVSLARLMRFLYAVHDYGVENVRLETYLKNHPPPLSEESFQEALKILTETESFILRFNKEKYLRDGLLRLGSPEGRYDYSFHTTERLSRKYRYVDRRRVLAGIFHKIVGREKNHARRHELVLNFLAKGIFQARTQPLTRNKAMIYDPVILLELHNMRCGNINRIACDLFSSVGYKTRVVQLFGHVISEIYYDSAWHYFDADTVLNSNSTARINGVIPDTKTLSKNPHLLDLKDFYVDVQFDRVTKWDVRRNYPCGVFVFLKSQDASPLYYVKTATPLQELNEYYGWNYYTTEKAGDIAFSYTSRRFPFWQPSLPFVDRITVERGKVSLDCRSVDLDKDLLGYRLFIGTRSRGWEYSRYFCGEGVKKHVRPVPILDPVSYDRINRMPPSDVALVASPDGKFGIDLPRGTYFMTVMAYDRHGEEIGKSWYMPSNEIMVSVP